MKKVYKIVQVLWVIVALIQTSLGKIEYVIFALLWAILLELLYMEGR